MFFISSFTGTFTELHEKATVAGRLPGVLVHTYIDVLCIHIVFFLLCVDYPVTWTERERGQWRTLWCTKFIVKMLMYKIWFVLHYVQWVLRQYYSKFFNKQNTTVDILNSTAGCFHPKVFVNCLKVEECSKRWLWVAVMFEWVQVFRPRGDVSPYLGFCILMALFFVSVPVHWPYVCPLNTMMALCCVDCNAVVGCTPLYGLSVLSHVNSSLWFSHVDMIAVTTGDLNMPPSPVFCELWLYFD